MSPELRKIYKRRLRCLEEKRAYYGIDTPPHILMEIEDIEGMLLWYTAKKKK
jgi:hypothetical protein